MLKQNLKKFNFPSIHCLFNKSFTVKLETVKNASPEQFNSKYYEEILAVFPKSKYGSVQFNKELFNKALKDAKTESDIEYLLGVISDYMGNYKPLTANDLDNYVKKALELNCPNKILPLLKHHRAFMYYPSKELITQLASFHIEKNDYEGYKAFYDSISRRYYIYKEPFIYEAFIAMAYHKKEFKEVVDCFLDILDYSKTHLKAISYNLVIYSNVHLLNDEIFMKVFQQALDSSQQYNFGTLLAMYVYYYKNNKNDMLDNLFDKMTQMTPKDLEVFDFEPIKEFIKELSEKQMEEEGLKKLFELIKRFPLEVYDNSYHEFINKVNS